MRKITCILGLLTLTCKRNGDLVETVVPCHCLDKALNADLESGLSQTFYSEPPAACPRSLHFALLKVISRSMLRLNALYLGTSSP
jgi:hypothetical protein